MHIQNVKKHMDDIEFYIPKQTNEIKHNDRNPIAVCISLFADREKNTSADLLKPVYHSHVHIQRKMILSITCKIILIRHFYT